MAAPVGLARASVFAITKEVTSGTYLEPLSGANFVPLRPGNELTYEPEQLESDEIQNDIGASKSSTGKEVVSGSHAAYLKHSGVEGQEPEVGILYESLFGSKYVPATEYNTDTGSTTLVLNVGVGNGANFRQGQSVLVKKGDGYKIRNIASITGDVLTLNFALDSAPASGIGLGKSIVYLPVASGHPTISTTKYLGSGFAKEVSAGNAVTEASITMDANGFGEVEFSFEGTKYYFNPIEITATTKYIDFTDDAGTFAAIIAEGIYKTPVALADAIASSLNANSTETYTAIFSSSTGKFTIATPTSSALDLKWNTGANTANTIASKIGFSAAADSTGALTYTATNEQSYAPTLTPAYDSADKIVIKDAELFIGNPEDNLCICAQSVSLTVSKTVEDVDCICEESGISEKIATERTAEMEITASLKKHDVALLDSLLKNNGISAMINCGPKTGGNWSAGKCFNAYLQKCTVSKYTTTGDSFIQVTMTLKGYVDGTQKDCYLNFV
jgi:hypothetical protein